MVGDDQPPPPNLVATCSSTVIVDGPGHAWRERNPSCGSFSEVKSCFHS
jgi:hypothetical protein